MRSISVRAFALLCLVGLAACVGSPEVVGSGRRDPASPDAPSSVIRLDRPVGEPARGSSSEAVTSGPGAPGSTAPYEGLGTWIDIYDTEVWEHPVHAVRSMAAHGIRTIYLQTSNFNRNGPFVHPEGVESIVDAAHRRGLDVVAWYLPGFRDVPTDLRRAIRSIRFRTDRGNRFDSFALDIESSEVRRPNLRTTRLLRMSAAIRLTAGANYPLGAIVASPHRLVRTDPRFWPGFPWRRLAETYDVFLPMTYYTYRVKGPRAAARYTAQNVQILKQETLGLNVPIHVVGGISFDATGPETQGFVHTVLERDVIGASYYTFSGITLDQWKALSALR
ncbi:MAG: hypothetical protein ACRDGK_08360 [Actinomycetota bacterium]